MARKMKMAKVSSKTLEEVYAEYVLDMKARNLRESTIRHYDDSIKQLYKVVPASTCVAEFTFKDWQNFCIAEREKGIKDISIFTYARDLKVILRFAMKQGYMPFYDLPLPKADKTPIETYTDEELVKLLKKPNVKNCTFTEYKCWVMVNFLLSTGIRLNSLVNLRVGDIDLSGGVVHVNVTKNRKPLTIPLNEDILKIMAEYLSYRQAESINDILFCNEFGKQMVRSTCYNNIYVYNKRRGVETTGLHRFRHTFAKKWVMMGGNVVILSKVLGHSSLEVTQNYINILVPDMADKMEEFNILRQFKKQSIKMKKR